MAFLVNKCQDRYTGHLFHISRNLLCHCHLSFITVSVNIIPDFFKRAPAYVAALIGRDLPKSKGPPNIEKGLVDNKIARHMHNIQDLTL